MIRIFTRIDGLQNTQRWGNDRIETPPNNFSQRTQVLHDRAGQEKIENKNEGKKQANWRLGPLMPLSISWADAYHNNVGKIDNSPFQD